MLIDHRAVFSAIPGSYLLLLPDAGFTIVNASEGYIRSSRMSPSFVGRSVFDMFPEREGATTMAQLRASLERVVATKQPDTMAVLRYDLDKPDGNGLEHRLWKPVNLPVLSASGEVEAVIHHVEDITEMMLRAAEHPGRRPDEAALRAADILEHMTDGFFLIDRAWQFTELNAEAQRILDVVPGQVIGRTLWEVYPDLHGTVFERSYGQAMNERQSATFTAFYDSHQRWYQVTARPALSGIAVFFRDVTEQRQASDEHDRLVDGAERERRMFEAALSNTPDLIYVFDLQKRFVFANQALLRTWGVSGDDARGKCLRELGYEEWHAALHEREFDQVVSTGKPVRGEVPFSGTDGRRIYDYIFSPVLGPGGEVVAIAGTTRDVTERQDAEQAIHEQAERLREADRAKDEFLAILAHELRNPLAPMRTALAVLSGSARDPSTLAIHETMARQVEHMVRLVDDLLEVSRITRGTLTLRRGRVAMADVVLQALELVKPLVEKNQHQVEAHLPEEPVEVDGDDVRLAQIVGNLLNNAAKYTPPGGRIRVAVRATNGRVRMSVRDNGIGIDAGLMPKMFDMFTRGDATAGQWHGGLGIGLALARRLAQLHGGTLEASSEGRGKGTEVVLDLAQLAPLVVPAPRPAPIATSTAVTQRILVVDDNVDAGQMLGMLLTMFGATVEVAREGLGGIAAFEAFAPRVVFLDIGMPGMDGYEVARTLRDRFADRRFTLVALTGWGQEDDKRRATDAGFDHHMLKPANPAAIRELLASLPAAA